MLKIKRVTILLLVCLILTACGGRFAVPDQDEIPNPAIGGRVFGPVVPK